MRGARVLLGPLAGLTVLLAGAPVAMATTPPPPPPPSTTVAPAVGTPPPTTAVAGDPGAPPTTAGAPAPLPPRAGSAIGGLDRRADDETWSVRRLATATVLGIAALAIVGHVYGRLMSISPRVGRTIARQNP